MKTAQVIRLKGRQAIQLPPEFTVCVDAFAIRKDGDTIILEPIKAANWPAGFFEEIHIEDPAFARPHQGDMPLPPSIG
ncbi:MAG TPA: hypothetical protein VF278_18445 [Pirellulales bacterium]